MWSASAANGGARPGSGGRRGEQDGTKVRIRLAWPPQLLLLMTLWPETANGTHRLAGLSEPLSSL